MQIHFVADYAGFELKNAILSYVRDELGYEVVDHGATDFDKDDDYPPFMHAAEEAVATEPNAARAILFGGSGQGEAITANRIPYVRAAVYYSGPLEIITLSRTHNNANVLSLGARFLSEDAAKEAVKLWLETPFSNDERHIRRIAMLDNRDR